MKLSGISEDNLKLFKAMVLLLLIPLLLYPIPHRSYSIIEYVIRPVALGNVTIFFSGVIIIVLFILGVKGLFSLERYRNASKIVIVIVTIIIIGPLMRGALDYARMGYYWLSGDSLSAVDIAEKSITMSLTNDEATITVNLDLVDYGKSPKTFSLRIYFPEAWEKCFDARYHDFGKSYYTIGNRENIQIREKFQLSLAPDATTEDIFLSSWHRGTVKFKIYNDNEIVLIKYYGEDDFALKLF